MLGRPPMGKILLFYKYVEIEDPHAIVRWQKDLCEKLGLTGRVLIATEGINATLGGSDEATDIYSKEFLAHPFFHDVDIKHSEGGAEDFPRLRVLIRNTIVNLGIDTKELTVKDTGVHLTPDQVHELLSNKPDDLIVLDTRNVVESAVGRFSDAVVPQIETFRQFPEYIEQNLEQFKDKQVLMYCTGGVRCERASAFLKVKGVAKEVYQIEGGIHRYVEKYPNGFFLGKNYVFDSRVAVKVNEVILSNCFICNTPWDSYTNCLNTLCNKHYLCCPTCIESLANCCTETCKELVAAGKVPLRKKFRYASHPSERNSQ